MAKSQLPEGFALFENRSVSPLEILELRQEPTTDDEAAVWKKCIGQALYVVGAREVTTARLVGIAMLAGNQRHAQLVDLTVHPSFREQGIGKVLGERLVEFARAEKIKYVGLTFDKTRPWLESTYARYDFVPIDFAMWLKDSLPSTQA